MKNFELTSKDLTFVQDVIFDSELQKAVMNEVDRKLNENTKETD